MQNRCHIFEMKDVSEAFQNKDFEEVENYGDELYGHFLHTWDDGCRKLLKCRTCGAYVLMQKSEFHSFSDAPDGYYTDWFPVSGPEEADRLNREFNGFDIERQYKGRYLRMTNSLISWAENRDEA